MPTITEVTLYFPERMPQTFKLGKDIVGIATLILDGCPKVILKYKDGDVREIAGIGYDCTISNQ